MDIFTWSIPFVTEKSIKIDIRLLLVTELLYHLLRGDDTDEPDEGFVNSEDIRKFKAITQQK